MAKDGVRQRKNAGQRNSDGGGDASNAKSTSSEPPSGGMTCFNWLMVLFFIFGVSGGASFFIYQEMTLTNRALLKELQRIKEESSDARDFKDNINAITEKLEGIKQLQLDIESLKTKQTDRSTEFQKLSSIIEESQTGMRRLQSDVGAAVISVERVTTEFQEFKSSQAAVPSHDKMEGELKRFGELMQVSNTNVAYLSDEILRLDKLSKEQFDQISSIQQEVIDLTAEKLILTAAVESIKSTIVSVREKVEAMQTEGRSGGIDNAQFEALEKKTVEEIGRISRELSETRENSAQWLQHSTNEMTENFQKTVEELRKEFNQIKVEVREPHQATESQSLINAVASTNLKLSSLEEGMQVLKSSAENSLKKQESTEKSNLDEFRKLQGDITTLTAHIRSIKNTDDELRAKLDAVTKDITTLSNEMNRITTTAGILEKRVDDVRNTNEKLDGVVQELIAKETSPKQQEHEAMIE